MDRPLYSFNFVQSGHNVILDACLPVSVGFEVAQLISKHSIAWQGHDDPGSPPKTAVRKKAKAAATTRANPPTAANRAKRRTTTKEPN
jgi:hypothetical protein